MQKRNDIFRAYQMINKMVKAILEDKGFKRAISVRRTR